MSLKKITPEEISQLKKEGIVISIDNGDLKALQQIVDKWNFLSIESALRFAIAVLVLSSEDKNIRITQNGEITPVSPSDALLKPKEAQKPDIKPLNNETR